MKIKFTPIDYDYFDWRGRNYARIIGRTEDGKRACVIDNCPVYLWAIISKETTKSKLEKLKSKIEKIQLDIKGRKTRVERVEVKEKKFLGKKVKALKIYATNYKDLHDIADKLDMKEIENRRGHDLGFITHYIMEKEFLPLNWYELEGEILTGGEEFGGIANALEVDICMKLDSMKKVEGEILKPKVLAYDIEADEFQIGEGEIVMVSLVSDNFKKVISCKKPKNNNQKEVEFVKDEGELIEKFVKYVKKISPDFLTGYFSDGFDLPYFKARAEKHNIKLSLGLDDSQPRFHRGIVLTGKISGIVHIDLLKFIQTAYSQYMKSETLSLDEVANEFLGERKKKFEFKHSSKVKEEEWEKYFEYNLHDSILTYNLFEKFWPDMLEFTRVIQEPIFDVSRNGMSKNVEAFILHNLKSFNEIPEKRPTPDEIGKRRRREKYEGAFVLEPTPGLYENIAMWDFTSSYGSTIVTYNLSKSTFLGTGNKKNTYSIETGGQRLNFSKEPGFFPEMLKEIITKRKQFKQELKETKKDDPVKRARSNAFKLLANASYGYQGFFGARYYCEEAAAATAAFAKKAIKDTIEKINKKGYQTVYSDTDSIAFLMKEHSKEEIREFLKKTNKELPGIMELELEDFFKRGLWVTTREGKIGAKKKYALIDKKGKLKIRGFETVRRDWCRLARDVQNKILEKILKDGNEKSALEYVKQIIKKIKNSEVDLKDLTIRTQLKKPISEYKANTPHVVAARKMKEREIPIDPGSLIEYYVAENNNGKKQLVRERVKLPDEKGEYDIKYYLERQILPAVENIFQVFNIKTQEMIDGKRQTCLSDF